jgi:TRAP-type C4-dicarboxylate transport system permease small subunit
MLVGVTVFCTAYVQSYRGHIGIEALSSLLSPRVNAARQLFVDVVSLAFCAFFSWKSWALFHEAWVDGMTTSSTFAPPLWIPYGMMAFGMTLLALQILVQILARPGREGSAP